MGGKRTKRCRGSLRIKDRGSFLKNKFAMLGDSAKNQNLSGWFSFSHFLCLSIKKKASRLDKDTGFSFILFDLLIQN